MIEFNGKQYETDKHNYLANLDDWSEPLALHFAELENIEMTPAHWEVVHFVQDFYREYDTSPAMRVLVKAMKKKLGEEKATVVSGSESLRRRGHHPGVHADDTRVLHVLRPRGVREATGEGAAA